MTYPSATLMRPYQMKPGLPCPAAVEVGRKTLRCQREHPTATRPHTAHVWRRALKGGGEMTVTWRQVVDLRRVSA